MNLEEQDRRASVGGEVDVASGGVDVDERDREEGEEAEMERDAERPERVRGDPEEATERDEVRRLHVSGEAPDDPLEELGEQGEACVAGGVVRAEGVGRGIDDPD